MHDSSGKLTLWLWTYMHNLYTAFYVCWGANFLSFYNRLSLRGSQFELLQRQIWFRTVGWQNVPVGGYGVTLSKSRNEHNPPSNKWVPKAVRTLVKESINRRLGDDFHVLCLDTFGENIPPLRPLRVYETFTL